MWMSGWHCLVTIDAYARSFLSFSQNDISGKGHFSFSEKWELLELTSWMLTSEEALFLWMVFHIFIIFAYVVKVAQDCFAKVTSSVDQHLDWVFVTCSACTTGISLRTLLLSTSGLYIMLSGETKQEHNFIFFIAKSLWCSCEWLVWCSGNSSVILGPKQIL